MPSQPAPFRPGRFARSRLYGGTPLTLPQATTLPATSITNTAAFLSGSVNPEGIATNYWFAWGTTPQYGTTTTVISAGSGVLPKTVGVMLTGLTTGATYHFAVVAQSAAGTVSGVDVSFVAQLPASQPVTAAAPPAPYGVPIEDPHLAYPFKMNLNGAKVVEQETMDEIFSCVRAIVDCPAGACAELPGFGVPDPTFSSVPIPTRPLIEAIERWEPRATETASVAAVGDPQQGNWQIKLLTTAPNSTSEI